jgi:5-methylcytosine-specific restriction endonuclease McrA
MNGELTDVNASVSTIRNLAKLMACVLQQPVLVLNRLWQAVNVCSARRALTLLFEGRAQVVYESPTGAFHTYDFGEWKDFSVEQESGEEDQINTISFKIGIPKVILLLVYDRFPKKEVKFTRHNIFERDRNQCQYCGKILERKLLNLDHVVPRDRGGPTTWENIVCSCIPCNTRKANRTPPEAGMHLIRKPKRPKWRPFVQVNFTLNSHSSWRHFLDIAYWNVEIKKNIS